MRVEFTNQPSPSSYEATQALWELTKITGLRRTLNRFAACMMMIALMWLAILSIQLRGSTTLQLMLITVILAACFPWTFCRLAVAWTNWQTRRGEPAVTFFDDEGFGAYSASTLSVIRWSGVDCVIETERHLFIRVHWGKTVTVFKSKIPENALAEILTCLNAKGIKMLTPASVRSSANG